MERLNNSKKQLVNKLKLITIASMINVLNVLKQFRKQHGYFFEEFWQFG